MVQEGASFCRVLLSSLSLLLPTASMPLAITAHHVTSYFSETYYRNIAIMILRLSKIKTVQTDIRLNHH